MLTQLEQKVLVGIADHIKETGSSPTIAEIAQRLNIRSRGTVHRYVQSLIDKQQLVRDGRTWRGLRLVHQVPEQPGQPEQAQLAKDQLTKDLTQQNLTQQTRADRTRSNRTRSNRTRADLPETVLRETGLPETLQKQGVLAELSAELPAELPVNTDPASLRIPLLGRIAAGLPIEALPDESQLDLAAFFIGPDRYALRVTGDSMKDAGIMDGDTVILQNLSRARSGDIVVALIDEREATLKRLGEYNAQVVELIPENSEMAAMRYAAARVSIQGVLVGQLRSY